MGKILITLLILFSLTACGNLEKKSSSKEFSRNFKISKEKIANKKAYKVSEILYLADYKPLELEELKGKSILLEGNLIRTKKLNNSLNVELGAEKRKLLDRVLVVYVDKSYEEELENREGKKVKILAEFVSLKNLFLAFSNGEVYTNI